jgi:hypothetical protein
VQNVLIAAGGLLKIADLGISAVLDGGQPLGGSLVGGCHTCHTVFVSKAGVQIGCAATCNSRQLLFSQLGDWRDISQLTHRPHDRALFVMRLHNMRISLPVQNTNARLAAPNTVPVLMGS